MFGGDSVYGNTPDGTISGLSVSLCVNSCVYMSVSACEYE